MTSPEYDFPESVRSLYPPDFRYPEGYVPLQNRVTDPETLLRFEDWKRPFVVRTNTGEIRLDRRAPNAVRTLEKGDSTGSLEDQIRQLKFGAKKGDSEDAIQVKNSLNWAGIHSEAGRYDIAIEMIRSLPDPVQKSSSALETLVRSLHGTERYAEALAEVRHLTPAKDITEYARELHFIKTAELSLHCGQTEQAELLLESVRKHGSHPDKKWPYWGMRAALAIHRGSERQAKIFIQKAGRVDAYHSYKMLWNRHLRPLAGYIREELLREDGEPKLYHREKEMEQLCRTVQAALNNGDFLQARSVAGEMDVSHITDWTSAEHYVLALAGLGRFEELTHLSGSIPGNEVPSIQLAGAVARMIAGRDVRIDELETLVNDNEENYFPSMMTKQMYKGLGGYRHFRERSLPELVAAATLLADGTSRDLPPLPFRTLADAAHSNWTAGGRDRYLVVHTPEHQFELLRYLEPRTGERLSPFELRDSCSVTERVVFGNSAEAENWLEQKLRDSPENIFHQPVWNIGWNGWTCCELLHPNPGRTPLVAKAVEIMRQDPDIYYNHGPARSSGIHVSFADRLVYLLRCAVRTRSRQIV